MNKFLVSTLFSISLWQCGPSEKRRRSLFPFPFYGFAKLLEGDNEVISWINFVKNKSYIIIISRVKKENEFYFLPQSSADMASAVKC
jgi:hypothetical protein